MYICIYISIYIYIGGRTGREVERVRTTTMARPGRLKSALSRDESAAPNTTCPQSWVIKSLDLYHKLPDSGERQYKSKT